MGFFEKISAGLKKTRDSLMGRLEDLAAGFTKVDEDFFDELEETLIMGDVGEMCIRDRDRFSALVTEKIRNHPLITVREGEVTEIPDGNVIIATGPLTSRCV